MEVENLVSLVENRQGGDLFKTFPEYLEICNTQGQGLYAWVTESQFKLMKFDGKDPIKFGQYGTNAQGGSTPQNTISSYTGTTTEPVIILWAYRLSDTELKGRTAFQIEKLMQSLVGPKKKDGKSTEVFFTSIEKIQTALSQVVFGKTSKEVYLPRQRQQEAIEKMLQSQKTGSKDFLLGAIMRFGKNFTFLTLSRELTQPGDLILVLTNKPGVFDSLKEEINSHVYFNGWEYVELKKNKDFTPNPNKVTVVAISKQLTDNKKSGEKVRQWIRDHKFKTAMLDECHSGTDTEVFNQLLEEINVNFKVWTSGTPFKTLASRGFKREDCYFYGYNEQQADKKAGLVPDAVTLNTFILKVLPELVNNPNYTDEEGFTLTKLFAVDNDGMFVFGGDVRKFIEAVMGVGQTKAKYSPFRVAEGNLDHTIWLLPSNVKMIEAVGKLLKEICPDTEVILATGNNSKDIKDVHDAIEMNPKTVTLTNMRFIEGTTVKKWTGAFLMSDTESIEKYFQFIFRVASPSKGKDQGFVFDFSPTRTFEMVYEMAIAQSFNNDQDDTQEVVKEWLDNLNIYQAGDGPSFKKVEVGQVLSHITNGDYRAASLLKSSRNFMNIEAITGSMDLFTNLEVNTKIKISTKFVENELNKGNSYTLSGKAEARESINPTDLQKAIQNISGILSRLPLIADVFECKDVDTLLEEATEGEILDELGIEKNLLQHIFNMGLVEKKMVNLYL